MATWDCKEREQFKIDAETLSENLKNDIDTIQSEKLNLVKADLDNVRNNVSKANAELAQVALDFFTVSNQIEKLKIDFYSDYVILAKKHNEKLKTVYYVQAATLLLVLISFLIAVR